MLKRVEKAGLGIAACALPARNDGAGRLVELSVDLGIEAETGQPALHVATLALVEAELIFGFLICFVGRGRRTGECRQVAGGRARAVPQRGDPRQSNRFELTFGVAGQIGTEFFRLVRILDRTPELELNLRSRACLLYTSPSP